MAAVLTSLIHATRDEVLPPPSMTSELEQLWPHGHETEQIAEETCTVILASGREDGGKRATLALSMACTALSMDMRVHLFLTGDGSHWAYEGHADGIQIDGFPALEELFTMFTDLGGEVALCSTCHKALCHSPGDQDGLLTRRQGLQIQGMAAVMGHVLRGRAVTF